MAIVRHRYTDYGKSYNQVTKFTIEYKEVFSFKDFLILLHEWLVENDYASREDEKFPEVFYMQKTTSSQEKEIKILWRVNKNPYKDTKQTLWRFDIDIDISTINLKDVEVVLRGKKIKAQRGTIRIVVVANLVTDAEKELQKKALLKIFKFAARKSFTKRKMELGKKLYEESYELHDQIKNFLQLETFYPEKFGKEFWPKRLPE